jgi:hypothetical protein
MTQSGGTPYWNSIKGGQTVPIKFKAYRITETGAIGAEVITTTPFSVYVRTLSACAPGTTDPELLPDATGGTMFRYADGQFIFNWATPKPAGKCYQISVHTEDGLNLLYSSTTDTIAREAYFKSK